MNRFSFQLEPVLELRRRREDEIALELARKNREILGAQNEMGALHEELKELQADEKKRRGERIDLQSMRLSVVYRHKLKKDILNKGKMIDIFRLESLEIKRRLTKAMQQRRAIELLRERRLAEWKKEARHEEQAFIDDISGQAYIRRNHAKKAVS